MLERLAEVLTNPEMVGTMSSDDIQIIRAVCTSVMDALGKAFIAAKRRELIAAANPKQAIDGFMNAEEVAKFLDLTKPAVYGLMRSGELKSVQIGKFKKVSVRVFLDYVWKLKQAGDADTPARLESFVEHAKKLAAAKPPRGK